MTKTKTTPKAPSTPTKKKKSGLWSGKALSSPNVGRSKTQDIDIYQLLDRSMSIAISYRPGQMGNGESSFLYHMARIVSDPTHGEKYSKEFGTLMFAPRRGNIEGTTAKKSKGYDWIVPVVMLDEGQSLEQAGRKLARGFNRFAKDQKMSRMNTADVYAFRSAFSNDPKPMNHFLLDEDCAKVLATLYADYSKDDLMDDNEIMTNFFGSSEMGKDYLGNMDEDQWEDLLD